MKLSKSIRKRIERMLYAWRGHRLRKRIARVVSAIVVFVTVYALILPAITLEQQTAAGMPGVELGLAPTANAAGVLTGTDIVDTAAGQNRSGQRILACQVSPHVHTETCWKEVNGERILICGKADYIVHEHDDSCYAIDTTGNRILVCTLPEIKAHTHDSTCYSAIRGELICTQQEHVHSVSCYAAVQTGTEQVLICGYAEEEMISPPVTHSYIDDSTGEEVIEVIQDAVVHHHTDACYAEQPVYGQQLVCQIPEHTHTDACYIMEQVLTCDRQEIRLHTHTLECYEKGPNGESPVEMGWVSYNENGTLTGDPAHLICGKLEVTAHTHTDACFSDAAAMRDGADFAITDAAVTGTSEQRTPENDSSAESLSADPEQNPAQKSTEVTLNRRNATDNMKKEADSGEDAAENDANDTESSENAADSVDNDADIDKNATNTDDDAATAQTDAAAFSQDITVAGADYTLTVSGGSDCGIPEGASFAATALNDTEDTYASYREQAVTAVSEISEAGTSQTVFGLFDLSIYDTEGNKIQPAAPVSVTVHFQNNELASALGDDGSVFAVHFPGTSLPEAETIQTAPAKKKLSAKSALSARQSLNTNDMELIPAAADAAGAVSFQTDSFSFYVIVGTTIEKTVLASDGLNYKVSLTCGSETGIPETAELEVNEILPENLNGADTTFVYGMIYEEYVAYTETALGMEEGSAGYIRLFDIKIVDRDDHSVKYQPKEGTVVDVRIELADKDSSEEAAVSTQVVHFADGAENGDVIENSTEGQRISFEASGFSIYAIVDSSKRLQYNFYDGTNLLVSEYIKKQDNVLQELFDPGVEPEYGQTFVGWAYAPGETNPSNIYTIEELNHQATARYNNATEELTEINVYAIYDEAWYLRYMDEDAQGNPVVLNVVRVRKDAADKNVTIDYTFTPEEGIVFEGWMDVATGHTYQQGDSLTLDHHVDLYVKLQGRNWLVFDSNAGGSGSGATYTPPQLLIGNEAITTKPNDPTRRGYTFTGWNTEADGSGTWWYKPDGSVDRFGNTLSSDTTLYAQWEANDTDYYVVFWKQKATDAAGLADDAKQYDYVSSEHRTAKTGETVSITTADRQKGGNASREYGYYFTYNGNNSDVTATVDANGTTILNVYYDRREITYEFTNTFYSYTQTTSNSGTQYGVMNGEYVELVRYNNRWYYYRYTPTTSNSGTQFALVDGEYVQLTRYVQYGQYVWSYDGRTIYNGTRYTRDTAQYNGNRYYRTENDNTQSFTGLYGSSFTEWPEAGDGKVWTYGGYLFPLALTVYDPLAAYNGNNPASFTDTTIPFTATPYSSLQTLYIYVQTEDGSWRYTDDYLLTTAAINSNSTWYPTETFKGFEISGYQLGDEIDGEGSWTPVTSSGSISYGNENVFLRYARNQHNIHFISQGNNVTGRTESIVDGVYYESSLSKYAEGGSAYYEPTNGNEGYYFAGWYADPDCQIPFDFNTTMPDNDITVYAKWDTYRVRVVLVPTPDNAQNDEVEFANNQALSFRLDYNEQVDDTNINSSVAKRPGYKLIGWYYSPDFDPETEIHFPVLINKDTPGVDMNYQSGEDWDKYGDNDGSHDNVRGILKLYAKWELDVDESSVYVEYDVDDVYRTYDTAGMLQTTIPVDDNKYALTNNNVTFQVAEAPTEYTSGFEFYRWVLLNPDGSESDRMYNPADTALEIPSSFIYEETVTDDLGHTATIKKIRLKAKFNIETEKVTTVTFDGNGGVTNDSAQQESVTESYPINKDFLMKDGDSFVKEGYTLIGWAFKRADGSKITVDDYKDAINTMTPDELIQAGIYQLGQKVAADNLEVSDENNWDPLENTVYAVWEINTYTVTVRKFVDGETAKDKEFVFTASASDDSIIRPDDSNFELVNEGEKEFAGIPYGTALTFTETPASGYSIKNVDAKQITNPDKTSLEESEYIDLGGADGKQYIIKGDTVITYTNEKAKEQKLRIKKVGDDAPAGLTGSVFDLVGENVEGSFERTDLTSMDGTVDPSNLGYLPSGNENDSTLFTLPIGTYTLTETTAPQYYDGISGAVSLNVTGEGISITRVGSDEEVPFDGASISAADANGIYTLTITNTRKKGTVKIIKRVIGTDADKDAEYEFTPEGLTGAEDTEDTEATFLLHGRYKEAMDETPEQKNEKVYEDVPYGTEFSITEADSYTDFDTEITAVYFDSNGEKHDIPLDSERDNKLSTGLITVEGDVTITYTNKRNKQPVAIYKTGLKEDETITTGAKFVVYKASEYNDTTQTANDGATVVAQGTTNENGILILEKLPIEEGAEYTEYRLVETSAPAGYILPDYLMKIFVYPDKVTGMQGTSNMTVKDAKEYADITDKSTTVLRVWNNPGVALPSTGGPGTKIIYLLGTILTGLAGAGLVMKRRRSKMA